jgi:transcriptional regulator with XRE-family HTH domain
MALGNKLKEFRQKKNWTLADLAKQSGVALSTLSRIETGKMTGTLESHIRIAKTLGVRLPELYAELDSGAAELQVRKFSAAKGAGWTALTQGNLNQKKLLPALVQIGAGKSRKESGVAGAERFLAVLKGKIELTVGESQAIISSGESIHFQAVRAHSVKNVGSSTAAVISVTAPPSI